jgi:hypothetical protein
LRGNPEELTALSQEPPLPTTHLHTDLSAYVLESVRAGRVYDVLAQLVVGPISERFTPVSLDEERRVFTAQLVLSQPEGLPLQLRVNLLGLDESELFDGAARCAPRAPLAQACHALQRAQQRARKLERELQQGGVVGPELTRQAERLLSELRASLKRALSGHKHKTQHAQQRHHEMERPTSHARQDALSAGEERVFFDVHRDTVVAVGPKGRAHVFSERGAHVTSLRLGVGELERKIGQGRWRPLEPARVVAFKEALRRS